MEKEETPTLTSTIENSIDVHDHRNVKRIGMVIKIKPDHLHEYLKLHADTTRVCATCFPNII
jgi:hypothetical protein